MLTNCTGVLPLRTWRGSVPLPSLQAKIEFTHSPRYFRLSETFQGHFGITGTQHAPKRCSAVTMKRLKRILGRHSTSPIVLRAFLVAPFLIAATALLLGVGQSRVLALLPAKGGTISQTDLSTSTSSLRSGANASGAQFFGGRLVQADADRQTETTANTVVIHGSLRGKPERIEGAQGIWDR
jgi:hypothetical protein